MGGFVVLVVLALFVVLAPFVVSIDEQAFACRNLHVRKFVGILFAISQDATAKVEVVR